ncbi:Adaptin N terminal region family protein [Histomonas meleagridis]|uniref:Adaptin N terminal region family protein n=1 Tax=Histomonas meleagridis TaxID=135588 RepID=UPI003559EA20|nr:Adaptin N terminal region family protein [Histomonas meleagridis]KAH0804829.1 Adaptin N terminal region family protein [Histomonas meleagridis]
MASVKESISKSTNKISTIYENVLSLLHLSLLGYDISFGEIHAVNLTQDSQMMTKALGYLACSALLDSRSDILIMIINSIQRDMSSNHPTSMSLALTAICHLVTADLIPPVIGYVGQALTHSVPLIRQKAVMCLHSFVKKDPSCIIEYFPELVRLLSDPDLSIVNAVINTFSTLLQNTLNIRQICDLLPDVCHIVNAIQQGQVKTEYFHQRLYAPFILTNIFRLFQRMGPHVPQINEEIVTLLVYSLQNGTTECSATTSVLYEAVRTCIKLNIFDIPQLRGAVSLFMSSEDQNLNFIGLGLLQSMPDFADEFQTKIIDCLEHPDATIRLRTLGLLHAMANENNAQIIILNMLKFFQRTKNERIRIELIDRITSIAMEYSPTPLWFAKTMEQLFVLGGDNINPNIAFSVLKLIEENCDDDMKREIVNLYIDVVQSYKKLSNVFVIIISRIIGKYAKLSDEYDLQYVSLLLCDLIDAYEGVRDYILNSLLLIIVDLEDIPQQVIDVFENYKQSKSIIVQEICIEALILLSYKETLITSIKNNEVNEDFDPEMRFLDDFVQDAIENKGLKEYIPLDERETDLLITPKSTIKYSYNQSIPNVYGDDANNEQSNGNKEEGDIALNTNGVKMVWGENGLTEGNDINDYNDIYNDNNSNTYENTQKEQKNSIFKQLSLKKSQQNQNDIRKEKMKESLFGNTKQRNIKRQITNYNYNENNEPENLYNTNFKYGVSSYGGNNLTEEDYQRLEQVNNEMSKPLPKQIEEFLQFSPLTTIYESGILKCSISANSGTIIIVLNNPTKQTPIVNLSIDVNGPNVLIKDIITHPQDISLLPPQKNIYYMTTFKFPHNMNGFPEFKFDCVIKYNNSQMTNLPLPINLGNFIIPENCNTQKFGQYWKQGGSELIYTINRNNNNGISLDMISATLNQALHVKTVERIGAEEIFIGSLFSTPFKILVHVKFNINKIDIKVLTKAKPLTQAIINMIQNEILQT